MADITTSKGQSLKELLVLTRHPNARSRKDALNGFLELIKTFPGLLKEESSTLIVSPLNLLADKDVIVRKTYVQYAETLIADAPESIVASYFHQMMVHVCSALTHLDESIRIDALKVFSLIVGKYPQLAVKHAADRLISVFLQLLAPQNTRVGKSSLLSSSNLRVDPNSKLGQSPARLQVISNLKSFIYAVIDGLTADDMQPCHFFRGSSLPVEALDSAVVATTSLSYGRGGEEDSSALLDSERSCIETLKSFQPILIQLWVECVPVVLNTGVIRLSLPMKTMEAILDILRVLWSRLINFNATSSKDIRILQKTYIKTFGASMPFEKEELDAVDAQALPVLERMSKCYLETKSLFE